ncbi:endochitinase A-like [Schistocerca americana]|uniref:endochitinase A-like n=1 Tax=Schistocerca americana TaxID=7009 RepID=UPI001F5010D4|nr:endochitinase A-like [Schistocerca americana]
MSMREDALLAKGVADRRPSGPAQATELIPVAAPSGPPLMTNRLSTTDADGFDSSDFDAHPRDRVFILMNKLAHGGPYPGREDDEAAILAFCNIQKAAALPHTRQHVSGVPPRAPPVASHDFAVPAVAASAGVAPLASTTEEVDVPPVAPLAPETREEPVAALAAATEMADMDLPDANLAEAIAESERRDTDLDAPRAPRKRRAVTHDDSDTPSQTSEGARPRKKATRASRTSTTESGLTLAGSSRSTAAQKSTKTTRRPTRSPAASRQPDEDGFVAPPRRHTARAAALQLPTPLPTANTFAGVSDDAMEDGAAPPAPAQKKPPPIVIQWAGEYKEFQQKLDRVATSATVKNAGRDLYKVTVSTNEEYRAVMDAICKDGLPFAAATKGGPASATRSSAQVEREPRPPTAPSTASPVGVAAPATTQGARAAAPRRRRRRAGRATPAAARRTVEDTLPPQRTTPRAAPRPAADAPRQSPSTEQPPPAAPVAEAAPAAPTAPMATDAAELRSVWHETRQPVLKRRINHLRRVIKAALAAHRIRRWEEKLASVDPGADTWELVRSLTRHRPHMPPLTTTDGPAYTPAAKAEALATTFAANFRPLAAPVDNENVRTVETRLAAFLHGDHGDATIVPPSEREVTDHLRRLPQTKAPGHDNVDGRVLRMLPRIAILYVVALFNAVFHQLQGSSNYKTSSCAEFTMCRVISLIAPSIRRLRNPSSGRDLKTQRAGFILPPALQTIPSSGG